MLLARVLTGALGAYAVIGVLFAMAFVIAGIHRVDPAAKDSGVGFRMIVFPGVAALWPLLFKRWRRSA